MMENEIQWVGRLVVRMKICSLEQMWEVKNTLRTLVMAVEGNASGDGSNEFKLKDGASHYSSAMFQGPQLHGRCYFALCQSSHSSKEQSAGCQDSYNRTTKCVLRHS